MLKENQKPLLSIVLPSYKKAAVMRETIERLYYELEHADLHNIEVIVVLDGILDESAEILNRLEYTTLKSIAYEKNQGKGYAVRRGWEISKGDYIGYIDCDLDIHPSAITYALSILSNEPVISGVVGAKRISLHSESYSTLRKVGSSIYRRFAQFSLHLNVSDTQTGVKLFREQEAKYLLTESTMNGFAWDLEVCAIAAKKGFLLEEIPVILSRRNESKSTLELKTALRAFFEVFLIRKRIKGLK